MFDIFLTDELAKEPISEGTSGVEAAYGKIRIGDYEDTFIASLAFWDRSQYVRHWKMALQRVLDGANRSALITSYVEPPASITHDDFLMWWPLYRLGETVYVQNQLLFFWQLDRPFSPGNPWESIRQRQTVNAEGLHVSEWITSVQSVRDCLGRKS